MSNDALLVVGLGNPGPKYERTRHNIGFEAAQELTLRHGGKFTSHKRTNADVAEINIAGRKVIVAKPRTFMNLSGGVVKALANYFKISDRKSTRLNYSHVAISYAVFCFKKTSS